MTTFNTLDGDTWKKAMKKSRKRRATAKERIEKQIEDFKNKKEELVPIQ